MMRRIYFEIIWESEVDMVIVKQDWPVDNC